MTKVLFPQIFEKMGMQELRALIAERSVMTIYIRGETVELPQHSVGFLLEGFVKSQGLHEELITSPAPLVPSHGNTSFQSADTSGSYNGLITKLYI